MRHFDERVVAITRAVFLLLTPLFVFGNVSCASNYSPSEDHSVVKASAKVDGILVRVYREYQDYLSGSDTDQPFRSGQPGVRVIDEYITIDAIAAGDPGKLKDELEKLGAKSTSVAGLYVSCELPITAIDALAKLASLKFARPVFEITH